MIFITCVSCSFDVKGYITGYGSADWKRTHEATSDTSEALKTILRNGATCVGKTVMDQLGFGYYFLPEICFPYTASSDLKMEMSY